MGSSCFDYADSRLKYEIFGYDYEKKNPLEDVEISNLVWDILELLNDFSNYKEGDTGEEDYLKVKNNFKKKWFNSDREIRMKEYIDKTLEKTKEELYKAFRVEEYKND